MKFTQEDGHKKVFNEINITPLTDIFLVLLIIMMVIAPSFQSNNTDIKMPEINSGLSIEEKNAVVNVTKEGLFFVNEKQVNENQLEQYLTPLVDKAEKKELVVRADKSTKSSEIMKIMKAAQDSGFEKLVVAGEPLKVSEQQKLKEQNKATFNDEVQQEGVE